MSDREAAIRERVTEIEREYWGQRDLRDERTCVTHLARAAALVDAELAAAREREKLLKEEGDVFLRNVRQRDKGLAAASEREAKLRETLGELVESLGREYESTFTRRQWRALEAARAALADGEGET